MEPGFSTADTVSRLAGRGVGMDVVASEVRQLGGAFDIKSKKGEGTTFTLRLPQTLAVTQAVFVKIGETTYAVPIASVRGVGRIARDQIWSRRRRVFLRRRTVRPARPRHAARPRHGEGRRPAADAAAAHPLG
jgi:chemotaxis protein histidine kinase CheA